MPDALTIDVELEAPAARLDDAQDAAPSGDAALLTFIGWLASLLVEIPVRVAIVETLGPEGVGVAGWARGGDLFLSARHRAAWEDPLSARCLGLLCHEAAHERAAAHDDDFRREIERMAGKLALLCLTRGDWIWDRWMRAASAGRAISPPSPSDDELDAPFEWTGANVEPVEGERPWLTV